MVWTHTLRHALARAVIPKFINMGYSASAALRTFSDIGPGLRRKVWLADWREISGSKKLERTYRFIPKKIRLSFQMMAPTESKQQRMYKYIFDVVGTNIETGAAETRTVSFGDDRRLSIEQATEDMQADLTGLAQHYKDQYNWKADKMELVAVYRKKTLVDLFAAEITEEERKRFLGLS